MSATDIADMLMISIMPSILGSVTTAITVLPGVRTSSPVSGSICVPPLFSWPLATSDMISPIIRSVKNHHMTPLPPKVPIASSVDSPTDLASIRRNITKNAVITNHGMSP